MMDPTLKARWVAALRSGDYKQGKGQLLDDKGRYCCLGVLCEVLGLEKRKRAYQGNDFVFEKGTEKQGSFPRLYAQKLGLYDEHDVLISMNDQGQSFGQIANYIEANL